MVYAIAAYSITLGALAIYFVVQQHRQREYSSDLILSPAAAGEESRDVETDPRRGFNLGACLLAPPWMLRHGMALPGAGLLLMWLGLVPLYLKAMWIPFIFVAAVPLAAGAALGFVGNRIAVEHLGIEQLGPFSSTQLPWAVLGIALYVFALPWAFYFAGVLG